MNESLETRFTNFLERVFSAESIDKMHKPGPNDPKMADYYLNNKEIIIEIKSLNIDQSQKGYDIINDYLSKNEIIVFGTMAASSIVTKPEDECMLKRNIQEKMTIRIKKVCSSANKQIAQQFKATPQSKIGVLVLINENNASLHPSMVAERVINYAKEYNKHFHYCLMIFESHKICLNGNYLPYPLLLDLTYDKKQTTSKYLLQAIQWQWARQYGHKSIIQSSKEQPLVYYPESIKFENMR